MHVETYEFIVLEICNDLFDICFRARLKFFDAFGVVPHFFLYFFQVFLVVLSEIRKMSDSQIVQQRGASDLKVSQILFFIVCSRYEPMSVNDVVNRLRAAFQSLFLLFGGRICTNIDFPFLDHDQLRFNLVHNVVNDFSGYL